MTLFVNFLVNHDVPADIGKADVVLFDEELSHLDLRWALLSALFLLSSSDSTTIAPLIVIALKLVGFSNKLDMFMFNIYQQYLIILTVAL